ncbi:tetratricopeptide repeat protein 1 [Pelomyxa schiedti]|nr:tetratricopeptide repeat protein 1 [Pelomyxa schiedti]
MPTTAETSTTTTATATTTTAANSNEGGDGDDVVEIISPEAAEGLSADAKREKEQGNADYVKGRYDDAITHYSRAHDLLAPYPDKFAQELSVMLGNRAACNVCLENWGEVIKDCTASLKLNPNYTKVLLRRARAYENNANPKDALTDYKKVAELEQPPTKDVTDAITRLEPLAKAQIDREMAEMLGKLKDLGNSILGRFGINLNNFHMEKDPNSGSYSIKYQNNP